MADIGHVALGAWSGGRFMHFGEEIDEERFVALIRPGEDISTVITADVYGSGACDSLVGRALSGLARDSYALAGAIGHDFYDGERQGSKGFPRFTVPRTVPPSLMMPRTSCAVMMRERPGSMRPSKLSSRPTHSIPLLHADFTTARMTALRPGASPPPVLMAMRRTSEGETIY